MTGVTREVTYDYYRDLFESYPLKHQPTFLLPPFNYDEYNLGVLFTRGPDGTRDMTRTAIITETKHISYQELDDTTNILANSLIQLGIRGGDRVVFLTDDMRSKDGFFVLFSTLKVNAITFTPNPYLINASQIEQLVEQIEPTFLLIAELKEASSFSQFVTKYKEIHPKKIYSVLPNDNRFPSLFNVELREAQIFSLFIQESKGLTPGYFCHTSGTSGLPKICLHFHSTTYYTLKAFLNFYSFTESDRFLVIGSHGGTFGIVSNACAFLLGATVILDTKMLPKDQIEFYKPTVFLNGPSFYHSLLLCENFIFPTSIKYLLTGAEKLQQYTFELFKKKYNLTIYEMIGGSELCFVFAGNTHGNVKAGSCGRKLPEYDLKIMDENMVEIKDDRKGTLYVKGPGNCFYFKNLEAQAKVVLDGWYCTNDLFSRDVYGYYYCYGREDDIIIVDGYNVSPVVVEDSLLNHPDIVEAAVVGIFDETICTSKIYACIVLKDLADSARKLGDILLWINAPSRVPPKSQVTRVLAVASLPRGGNGNKLNRKALSNIIENKLA